ncbi:HAD family hydrolase [uncultured Enterococcus sp.]|uniref:HAD family hydrolase n=1 Tax=uncultured Enterococcus sp. TaxID=167972 RepID=UPI002AA88146|nr:HAD family hydrolase [uncultured Enterococcus sp.]
MNYQGIIYFDLDGTLLNQHSVITKENQLLLDILHEKGYLCVAASGRAPFEIEEITAGTAISSYISLNGQYICVEGDMMDSSPIDTNTAEELLNFSTTLSHPVASYGKSSYFINFIDETTRKLYKLDNAPLPAIDAQFHQKEVIYMLYLFSEAEHLDTLYKERFNNQLSFFRDSPFSLAFVNKGISKRTGIHKINEHFTHSHTLKTYAFGDGNNDLDMFQAVDQSIAMGNASNLVKSHADFVTKSHLDGGILHALQYYGIV